jgi:hypothetical protein
MIFGGSDMTDKDTNDLAEIHESFINGQNFQGCEQIDEYGSHLFWIDYIDWLESESSLRPEGMWVSLRDIVKIYHRVRG